MEIYGLLFMGNEQAKSFEKKEVLDFSSDVEGLFELLQKFEPS